MPAQASSPSDVIPNTSFRLRPFSAAITNGLHGWTAEDGRDTNVIARLAHNNLEYQRMLAENDRIQYRQLVYRNDPVAAVIQRAKRTGEPVDHIVLPGLDGEEFDVVITARDLNPSGQIGTMHGHVEGMPDSLVTVAFKFGREAFSIEFPEARYCLEGNPREPGEVVIKTFDPEIYTQGMVCGNDKKAMSE